MKKYYYITLSLLLIVPLFSCEKWLDVSPKTEIKADDNFESEQGFKDALTGVYLLMTDESLYGRELTFGFTDVLAQYYTGIYQTSHAYYYPAQYDYTDDSSVSIIDNIWGNMYNAIANLNELIAQLEKTDKGMFTGRNYDLIKGEAYGLRAFLHFDLLRLFGKSYLADPNEDAVPYVTTLQTTVTALSSVSEVIDYALSDLNIAQESLLKDPVIETNTTTSTDDESYERDRFYKFNYYAVKLLMARVYLYKQDYTNAYDAAQEVINQSYFTWTPESEITTAGEDSRNYVLSEELIFALYDGELRDFYTSYFTTDDGLYMYDENYEGLFELNKSGYYGDYRYTYLTELLTDVDIRFSTKLKQPTGSGTAYLYKMPLMRISEAYYIAAECALNDDDIAQSVSYLNTVRLQRNLPDQLSESLTKAEVSDEIYKEFAKEFMCEGQLFYYFKRLNMDYIPVPSISGGSLTYSYVAPDYVLPLPDDEIEYGGR